MALEKILKNASGIPTGEYERIAGGTLWADSPIGTILAYGGAIAPAGWFICQGQELTKTDYAELYAVIGDSFGTASVNTKFVLPDLREATTKGVGLTGKSNNHYDSDGVALGEFIEDRVQDHGHSSGGTSVGNGSYIASASASVGNVMSSSGVAGTYRSGATTEVKAVGVNYIIKAKQVALPADLESAVEDAVGTLISHKHLTGGPASSSETLASKWDIIEFSDKFCLCIGQNTATGTLSARGAFNMQLPSGYTFENIISANGFANGNTEWVTRTSHQSGNGAVTYLEAGTYVAGYLRHVVIASKT